jgi:hypothetical protein
LIKTIYPVTPFPYSLDKTYKVSILNLIFKDSSTLFLVDKEAFLTLALSHQIEIIEEFLKTIDRLTSKGYLNSQDLRSYAILSELLPRFITSSKESEWIEYVNGEKSMESYKWLYNILILTLYFLCISSLYKGIEGGDPELLADSDLLTDLKIQERVLFSRLDPSIRHHMRKTGISIVRNTYVGYDTEFNNLDLKSNSLVSAQLAITTKVYVKLPNAKKYTLSSLNVEENKLQKQNTVSNIFNYAKIEMTIQWIIQEVKYLKYQNYDESMLVLNQSLKLIKGINHFESEEHTLFSLPRSAIQPFIIVNQTVCFKDLVQIASSIAKPFLDEMNLILTSLIKDICSRNISLLEGKDKMLEEIYKCYGEYRVFAEKATEQENQLPLIFRRRVSEELKEDEQKLNRIFLSNLFKSNSKVSITTTKNYYFIAHLTQADLSMLSDFEEIKDGLSIVNGSFITLRDPLKLSGRAIHIRDTMLLAPGGSKSLAHIGKLYGENFHKIQISQKNLNDMQSFFQDDQVNFITYALRDALISLVHAL